MSEMNHCGCLTMSEIRARTLRDAARELRLTVDRLAQQSLDFASLGGGAA